jgi:hypothetical protein
LAQEAVAEADTPFKANHKHKALQVEQQLVVAQVVVVRVKQTLVQLLHKQVETLTYQAVALVVAVEYHKASQVAKALAD